ncbi:radical SAM protein [Halothermothrix orenii]|uniref:Radical SAM domain protein n=1 Tax=Halothermothrix orenii (strain H 168 / OCM 544 / DSM 9562) TaxID=373903 RepID=B8D1W4_HALOH|nr:radical SAM protein [Halothermothrix orenii]ACL69191.1 Radical SAM domain protein [Halothermothrix orenii H 168]
MIKESLSTVTLNVTSKCNYNCSYCASCNKEDLLELKDIKMIIDNTVKLKTQYLILSGGEPTLRNDYQDIIDYANKNGLITVLFSNGSQIDNVAADYIKENINIVRFTLDSTKEEKYDKIKGRGTFANLIKTIDMFNDKKIPVNLNIPVNYDNIEEIEDIILFSIDKGIQTLRFAPIIPSADKHIYKTLLTSIFENIIKYEPFFAFPDFKPVGSRDTFINAVSNIDCPGGIISININSNGEVTVCSFFDEVTEGNLKEEDLFDIWFNNYEKNLNQKCKVIDVDIGELLSEVLTDKMWGYSAVRKAISFWYTEIAGKEKMCYRGFPFWQLYFSRKPGE